MNERIKLLIGQALDEKFAGTWSVMDLQDLTKFADRFAELIVEECTMVLFDESERLSELYSEESNWQSAEEYEICSNQCVNDIVLIEKHFGVEE